MSRLQATLRDFWASIGWLERAPKALESVGKILPVLLFALGLGTIGAIKSGADWASRIDTTLVYLAVLAVAMYLAGHFAIAWHKNGGPVIWIGRPQPDPSYRCFDVPVENRGLDTAYARAYVQQLCDKDDRPIPRIDDQIEVHFRGKFLGEKVEVHEGRHPKAVVVASFERESQVFPALWPPIERPQSGPAPQVLWPLLPPGPPVPLAEQPEVRFIFRVDFCDDGGKVLKTRRQRYSLTPDPTSEMRYQLQPIR